MLQSQNNYIYIYLKFLQQNEFSVTNFTLDHSMIREPLDCPSKPISTHPHKPQVSPRPSLGRRRLPLLLSHSPSRPVIPRSSHPECCSLLLACSPTLTLSPYFSRHRYPVGRRSRRPPSSVATVLFPITHPNPAVVAAILSTPPFVAAVLATPPSIATIQQSPLSNRFRRHYCLVVADARPSDSLGFSGGRRDRWCGETMA